MHHLLAPTAAAAAVCVCVCVCVCVYVCCISRLCMKPCQQVRYTHFVILLHPPCAYIYKYRSNLAADFVY